MVERRTIANPEPRMNHADDVAVLAAGKLSAVLRAGGTVWTCGNGGSAEQASHLAAELVGRFEVERAPYRAVCLAGCPAVLTALANDYGYAEVFARQLRGLGRPGDALVALTTSGRSENVLRAVDVAHDAGMMVLALTGPSGLAGNAPATVLRATGSTAGVQELHLHWVHTLARAIEQELTTDERDHAHPGQGQGGTRGQRGRSRSYAADGWRAARDGGARALQAARAWAARTLRRAGGAAGACRGGIDAVHHALARCRCPRAPPRPRGQ